MSLIQKEAKPPLALEKFKKRFSDIRVLALDKDYDSLVQYKKLFSKVVIFNNSVEALAAAEVQKFDLFILDFYQYPINGLEVLTQFHKLPLNIKTPTLFVTEGINDGEILLKLQNFLFKPIDALEFYLYVNILFKS
jgi:response regulator RpfG family c-di-GMP phosphodiesterase